MCIVLWSCYGFIRCTFELGGRFYVLFFYFVPENVQCASIVWVDCVKLRVLRVHCVGIMKMY